MKIKLAIPSLLLFVAAAVSPVQLMAQSRTQLNLRPHTQSVRDRGPHLHDHSSRPHTGGSMSRS